MNMTVQNDAPRGSTLACSLLMSVLVFTSHRYKKVRIPNMQRTIGIVFGPDRGRYSQRWDARIGATALYQAVVEISPLRGIASNTSPITGAVENPDVMESAHCSLRGPVEGNARTRADSSASPLTRTARCVIFLFGIKSKEGSVYRGL